MLCWALLPCYVLIMLLLWQSNWPWPLAVLILLVLAVSMTLLWYQLQQKLSYQFRTLSNLLEAIIQGDFSLRARAAHGDDASAELFLQMNQLAAHMGQQQRMLKEQQLLVEKIVQQLDLAILTLHPSGRLLWCNDSAVQLLGQELRPGKLLDFKLLSLPELASWPEGEVRWLELAEHSGEYYLHKDNFLLQGEPHWLLFITDVSHLLRQQERKTWQNLLRVISHEINNSLAPIRSVSGTLQFLSRQQQLSQQDLLEHLALIEERAGSLQQFMQGYQALSKLPEPKRQPCSLSALLAPLPTMFPALQLQLPVVPDLTLLIDPGLVQQVLINLLRNASEAGATEVRLQWQQGVHSCQLLLSDNGPGISNTANLFVPFYSTKATGSGIGLVLSRQIMLSHAGDLTLTNNKTATGALALLRFPLSLLAHNSSSP